jgi:hypothetical protein
VLNSARTGATIIHAGVTAIPGPDLQRDIEMFLLGVPCPDPGLNIVLNQMFGTVAKAEKEIKGW